MVEKIDAKKFEELLNGDTPMVCDFYATWCGPCKMIAPVMEKCSELFSDKAKFVKVDIDENFELASRYNVMSIPFVAVFKGGELADQCLGYTRQDEMTEFLNNNL